MCGGIFIYCKTFIAECASEGNFTRSPAVTEMADRTVCIGHFGGREFEGSGSV